MGKYGTNLEGFGAFEGGVNADKGAPLVSTSSDGETALLFGPAALREIQTLVANGDFAIPPDAAGDTITSENPLPYWTFTDDDSAGAITCAIVVDSGSGSGNILRWTVAAGTTTGKTATLSRYLPIAATRDRAYAFYPEFTMGGATNVTSRKVIVTMQFYTAALATTGTAITHTYDFNDFVATETAVMLYGDTATRLQAPADAAFAKISLAIDTTGTNASASTLDVYEIRLLTAQPMLLVGARENGYGPAAIFKTSDSITLMPNVPSTWTTGTLDSTRLRVTLTDTANPVVNIRSDLAETVLNIIGYVQVNGATSTSTAFFSNQVPTESESRFQILASGKQEFGDGTNAYDTNLFRSAADTLKTDDSFVVGGNIGFDGVIYGTSALTGPNINLGGTNTRLWVFSDSAADLVTSTSTTRSGVLVTKPTAGQPSTNINGTATTDAFADALRNGGIAVDTSNNRAYFYSGGWKFAALTTPSDSRLKDEITEITGALDTLRQLVPVAFKWKAPEAHGRTDAVADDGKRLGFIADQVATTDLAHWVETLGVDEREAHLVDTTEVLAVNIPQNEMEALVVQALLDIDTRLKALESR